MSVTLPWLLGRKHLRLSLIGAVTGDPTAAITWVHSSDLDDPTPFLSPGNVLLTDGAQFGFDQAVERYDYDGYVDRLVAADIVGLGFATQFLHQGMPAGLEQACERAGLALIAVPDRVPFIAVIREVADQIAAERTQRMEWSNRAQRAISRAALKPTGLRSTLGELERQLSCWVGLFDASGGALLVPAEHASDDAFATDIRHEVARALHSGRRSSTTLTLDSGQVTVQTFGQSGQLRGALVLGRGVPLDRAENELVTSVIALATLALEQNRERDVTRGQLRCALLELLLGGSESTARPIAEAVWGALPAEPITVVALAKHPHTLAVLDLLESLAADSAGQIFYAQRNNTIVIVAGPGPERAHLAELITDHELAAGQASAADYGELGDALRRASHALQAGGGRGGISDFADIAATGMLGVLHAAGAEQVALTVLAPLLSFEAEHSSPLVDTLLAWFANDCSWGATAGKLGVHRHTVRSRVDQAAQLLGLNLETFEGRLELWAALRLLP